MCPTDSGGLPEEDGQETKEHFREVEGEEAMTSDDAFFRYPHTPHLLWLGPGSPRDDKVLSPAEAARFFDSDVVVEEKVDGANLGLSVDASGVLRAQNRGAYIGSNSHLQFKPLRRWMDEHRLTLLDALGRDLILFGEWCVAVHSIEYTALPDWFLAFDVYERSTGVFWSADRRDALCAELGIHVVPQVAKGRFDRSGFQSLLGPSKLGAAQAEGIYVRIDEGSGTEARLAARSKIVRAEFQQGMPTHWSSKGLRLNRRLGAHP
jgi:hypothetical protein